MQDWSKPQDWSKQLWSSQTGSSWLEKIYRRFPDCVISCNQNRATYYLRCKFCGHGIEVGNDIERVSEQYFSAYEGLEHGYGCSGRGQLPITAEINELRGGLISAQSKIAELSNDLRSAMHAIGILQSEIQKLKVHEVSPASDAIYAVMNQYMA